MNRLLLLALQVFCLMALCLIRSNARTLNQPKRVVGINQQRLVPFPRVGRGGEWDWNELEMPKQRANLVAFPRVGRGGMTDESPDDLGKMNEKKKPHQMWFGPRLGRVQKRDIIVYDIPHDYPRAFLFPTGSQEAREHLSSRMSRGTSDEAEDIEDSDE